jgi:hypothetical protein
MDARRFIKSLLFTSLVLILLGGVGVALAQGLAAPSTRPAAQDPVGSAFTYQGRLMEGGNPANGLYDFKFELFDSTDDPMGPVLTLTDQPVADGLFTVQLDFGDVFDGRRLWLQISVRPSGSADPYTIFAERQELTAAPYALYALDVGVNYAGSYSQGGAALDLGCAGCVNSTEIQNGTISFADIGQNGCLPGQVMKWTGAEWICSNAYARTVIVSPLGTPLENGDVLLTALKGIADATVGNPYLLKIEPGRYDLGSQPLTMKPWVDIEGSGELVTTIVASGSLSYETGTVVGANNAELRFLTVENKGGSDFAVAIYNGDTSPRLTHVTASAWGGNSNFGVRNSATTSASPTMANVIATASGGGTAVGIDNAGSAPTMRDVTAQGSGATGTNYGIYNDADSITMTDVTAIASGGSSARAIRNAYCSTTMTNVTATASGGSSENLAVYNQHSPAVMTNVTASAEGADSRGILNSGPESGSFLVTVDHSRISGDTYGIYNQPTSSSNPYTVKVDTSLVSGGTNTILNGDHVTTLVGGSQLEGGPVSGSGFTCAGVYDENYAFYSSTCPL